MVIVSLMYKDPTTLKIADHDIKLEDISVMNRGGANGISVRMNNGYTFVLSVEMAQKLSQVWLSYAKGELKETVIEIKEDKEPKPVRNLVPNSNP
jgi:hypothetical protein